jgi:hypothetical protein
MSNLNNLYFPSSSYLLAQIEQTVRTAEKSLYMKSRTLEECLFSDKKFIDAFENAVKRKVNINVFMGNVIPCSASGKHKLIESYETIVHGPNYRNCHFSVALSTASLPRLNYVLSEDCAVIWVSYTNITEIMKTNDELQGFNDFVYLRSLKEGAAGDKNFIRLINLERQFSFRDSQYLDFSERKPIFVFYDTYAAEFSGKNINSFIFPDDQFKQDTFMLSAPSEAKEYVDFLIKRVSEEVFCRKRAQDTASKKWMGEVKMAALQDPREQLKDVERKANEFVKNCEVRPEDLKQRITL